MKKYYFCLYIIFCCVVFAMPASASWNMMLNRFANRVSDTWYSNHYELYIPVHTWHNRALYDREKTRTYNENPWGGGIGKYMIDEKRNQHMLYAMAFKDSHNKWQPIAGYGWQKNWYFGFYNDIVAGLGYTLFISARDDIHYIPFPGILPLVALEYRSFAVQGTYIPGVKNKGNVAFFWAKIKF